MTDPPGHQSSSSDDGGVADSRAEQVLAQALRVMAGGGKGPSERSDSGGTRPRRLTDGQLILLTAIVGLLVGITAGFVSLMF